MTVDLNGPNYAAAAGPIFRAVWDDAAPPELFAPASEERESPEVEATMRASLEVLRGRREAGSLYEADGRLAADLLQGDLARAGYWGLLIPQQYGGSGATLSQYARFLTRVATIDGSVANLLSVHSCLGPGGVVRNFGSDEQRGRWLPLLARGERLGVFAMTEPQAGSDLTAIATRAELAGDVFRVTGEKVFITNLAPGRVAALVCRVEGRPAVLIAQLPDGDTDAVRFLDYGIHAARRSGNRGMRLSGFEVSRHDQVTPARGDGLTIAYHGLNQGRMSLCAVAAGTLRRILAALLPWVRTRRTYGAPIGSRDLVQRRIGRLASLIVGCDALAAWCASLLDQGYRGELECIVAKVFAAEALKEAAIELALRTFGGRAFLHGNLIGDSLHDLLAPCIYEGESELLGLSLLRSLCKQAPAKAASGWISKSRDLLPSSESRRARPEGDLEFGFYQGAAVAVEQLRMVGKGIRLSIEKLGTCSPFFDSSEPSWSPEEVERASRLIVRHSVLACVGWHVKSHASRINILAARCLEDYRRGEQEGSGQHSVDLGQQIIHSGWEELEGVPCDAGAELVAFNGSY